MRIGELLTRVGLSPDELSRALEEQARNGGRLCSLLISRGAIDFDIGARALGEQWGSPCVLARHLANRDAAAAQLIAPELARELCVLPIGRSSSGALIVAVRDPEPRLQAALQAAAGCEIAMAVSPATRLERLVVGVYGDDLGEFEVDVESRVDAPGLSPPPSLSLSSPSLRPMSAAAAAAALQSSASASSPGLRASASSPGMRASASSPGLRSNSAPAPAPSPPSSLLSPLDMLPPSPDPPLPPPPASNTLLPYTLSPQPPAPQTFSPPTPSPHTHSHQTLPPGALSPLASSSGRSALGTSALSAAAMAAPSVPSAELDLLNPDTLRLAPLDDTRVAKDPSQSGIMVSRTMSARSLGAMPPVAQTLATTRAALAFADSRDSATDVAMTFISGRWRTAAILAVRGATAIGYRAHAIPSLTGVEVPVDPTSALGRVVATKQPVTLTGAVAADPLGRILSMSTKIAAAPVLVAGEVVAIIAAGDSVQGPEDAASIDELTGIATALGESYERIRRA